VPNDAQRVGFPRGNEISKSGEKRILTAPLKDGIETTPVATRLRKRRLDTVRARNCNNINDPRRKNSKALTVKVQRRGE